MSKLAPAPVRTTGPKVPPAPGGGMRKPSALSQLPRMAVTAGVGVVFIAIWQIAYQLEVASKLVLPAPSAVLDALASGIQSGLWWPHIRVTVTECIYGFAIGVVAALVLGSIFAFSKFLQRSVYPYILAAQTFPKIAIAPLLVAWLGYDMTAKVVIGAMLAFFPVFVNTVAGLQQAGKDEVDLLKAMQASKFQEFRFLRFPTALSYIYPALSVASVHALLGVIVGEFVGSRQGLGFLIQNFAFQGNTAGVYAVLAILGVVGIALYLLLLLLEKKSRFQTS